MQWHWVAITVIALYFAGHLLHHFGLLWAALVWLALSVTIGLLFGVCVRIGEDETTQS